MDNNIVKIINSNLTSLNLPPYINLEKKEQERLVKLQSLINLIEDQNKDMVTHIKDNKLTKTTIAKKMSLARKTIYNDKILNAYIDYLVSNQFDYFNENIIETLEQENRELKNHFYKIMSHLIDTQELKKQVSDLNEEILRLTDINQRIQEEILEKNRLLINKGKLNNIINFSN